MAPRNNDSNTSYATKKNSFAMDDCEVKDIVPGLLHKKHKVVKLVRGQMLKIQEEGLLCPTSGPEPGTDAELLRMQRESNDSSPSRQTRLQDDSNSSLLLKLLLIFLLLLLLMLIMVWISAGPLSNSIAHTPIPMTSLVRTEGICSLEKKYLLRWSKPEYYE